MSVLKEDAAYELIASSYRSGLQLSRTALNVPDAVDRLTVFGDPYIHLSMLRLMGVDSPISSLQRYLLIKCVDNCVIEYIHGSHIASILLKIMPYSAISLRAPTSRLVRTRSVSVGSSMYNRLEMRHCVCIRPSKAFATTNSGLRCLRLTSGDCVVLPQYTWFYGSLSACTIELVHPCCWGIYPEQRSRTQHAMPNTPHRPVATASQHTQIIQCVRKQLDPFEHKIFCLRNIVPIDVAKRSIISVLHCPESEVENFLDDFFTAICPEDTSQTHVTPCLKTESVKEEGEDEELESDTQESTITGEAQGMVLSTFYHRLELISRFVYCSRSYLAQHHCIRGPRIEQLYLPIGRSIMTQSPNGLIHMPAALPLRFILHREDDTAIILHTKSGPKLNVNTPFATLALMLRHLYSTNMFQCCDDTMPLLVCMIPNVKVKEETSMRFYHLVIVLLVITVCPIVVIDEAVSIAIFVLSHLLSDNRTFDFCLISEIHDYQQACQHTFWDCVGTDVMKYPSHLKSDLLFRSDDRSRIQLITTDTEPRSGNRGNHRRRQTTTVERAAAETQCADSGFAHTATSRLFWLHSTDAGQYMAAIEELKRQTGKKKTYGSENNKKKTPRLGQHKAKMSCRRVQKKNDTLFVLDERLRKQNLK